MDIVTADDEFFAMCLDLVPRRFVVPLTDSEKEKLHERSLPKKAGGAGKQPKETKSPAKSSAAAVSTTPREPKKPNAVLIQEAFEKEKKEAAQVLKDTNTVAAMSKPMVASEVATVSELRARLLSRVEENRKRAGVPGARAERDKLLPPKQKKPRVVKEEEQTADAATEKAAVTAEEEVVAAASKQKQAKPAVTKQEAAPVVEEPPVKPVAAAKKKSATSTIEERISYGALKIDEQSTKQQSMSTSSILNVKKLIKKAQNDQARMEHLKEQGKDDIIQDERWSMLEKKATGEKIRDDPKLLKKALKSLEKKKEKASKTRKERKQNEEQGKKERIDQREKNIKERSKLQIQKRSGGRILANPASAEKKTRKSAGGGGGGAKSRPGFEGRKTPANKKAKTSSE